MYLWRQLLGFRLQPPGARDPFGGSGQRIFCEFLAGRMPGESGCRSLSTMFRSSFFEKGGFFTEQCTLPNSVPYRLSAKTPGTYAWPGWTRGHAEPISGPSPSGDL